MKLICTKSVVDQCISFWQFAFAQAVYWFALFVRGGFYNCRACYEEHTRESGAGAPRVCCEGQTLGTWAGVHRVLFGGKRGHKQPGRYYSRFVLAYATADAFGL